MTDDEVIAVFELLGPGPATDLLLTRRQRAYWKTTHYYTDRRLTALGTQQNGAAYTRSLYTYQLEWARQVAEVMRVCKPEDDDETG